MTIAEAKEHLEDLEDELPSSKKSEIVLMQEGQAVARLTGAAAVAAPHDLSRAQQAVDRILELHKQSGLGGLTIKDLIEAGRL